MRKLQGHLLVPIDAELVHVSLLPQLLPPTHEQLDNNQVVVVDLVVAVHEYIFAAACACDAIRCTWYFVLMTIFYDQLKAEGIINAGDSFFDVYKFDLKYLSGVVTNAGGNTGAHHGETLRYITNFLNIHENLPEYLVEHCAFQLSDIQNVENVKLTENFPCYDCVRMIGVNEKYDQLCQKNVIANDGTNNGLIRDILQEIQQIYWKYRFHTENPIRLDQARLKLQSIKCCNAIAFFSEKTSKSEGKTNISVLKRFSGRVDGKVTMNHMGNFGKVFQILNAHGQEEVWSSIQVVVGTNDFNKQVPYVSIFSGSELCSSLQKVTPNL